MLLLESNSGTEKGHKRDMTFTAYPLSSLRSALKHLYEPSALRASPLVAMLGPVSGSDAPALLRRTLTQAIEALKPEDDVPAQAPSWRVYEILYYRYVQQCSQEEVADQLGLSVRHLKREQRRALEVLAQYLGEQYNLSIEPDEEAERDSAGEEKELEEPEPAMGELTGLEGLAPSKPVTLAEALPSILELVQSFAAGYGVSLHVNPSGDLPALAVHGVVLRQALLSLLYVAIRHASGGRVTLTAVAKDWNVHVRIEGEPATVAVELSADDMDNLNVARQLAANCGGSLAISQEGGAFAAALMLPAAEQVPVLVIDDHVDTLQLLQRYATDTRYRVHIAQNAEQAFALAREVSPQAIVLDVMMPEVDGWELLGRLKQHPLTSGLPVIACTILAQEELAYSLGVSGFMRKPVSRRDFLAALDRLLASSGA